MRRLQINPRGFSRAVGIAACFAACSTALASQAVASDTHPSSRCATFHARGAEYGVYIVDGQVKCSVATGILKAIASGKGKEVDNGNSADSYVLYGGWLCPFGNMGEQTCEHSKHPVSNPSQDIESLLCSVGTGCPKQHALPGLAPAGAAAKKPVRLPPPVTHKKKKPTHAPNCADFSVQELANLVDLDGLTLKSSGPITGARGSSDCLWTDQVPGEYSSGLAVIIAPYPAFLGRAQIEAAARGGPSKGQQGGVVTGAHVPKGTVAFTETKPSENFMPCTEEELQKGIQPEQGGPTCNPEPSAMTVVVTAYGSPKPNVEPILVSVILSEELNEAHAGIRLNALTLVDRIYESDLSH